MTFRLQDHDSQKRCTDNKDCTLSKASAAAHYPSTRNTHTNPSDTSDSTAKHSSLLKSGSPYTHSVKDPHTNEKFSTYSEKQENSLDLCVRSHPVRGRDTNISLLKSKSHTVTHTLLTGDNQKVLNSSYNTNNVNTFSENVILQTRHFRQHCTYSATYNNSAKNTERKLNISANTTLRKSCPDNLANETSTIDRDLSLRCTPRKHSRSAQRELQTENHNITNHHDNLPAESTLQNRNGSLPSPKHARADSDTPTASKQLLSTNMGHTRRRFSENMAEKEDFSVCLAKSTLSYSATHNHPSNVLPETPAENFIVPKSLSIPLRAAVSYTPNASDMPMQFSVHPDLGVTPTPPRPPHQEEKRTPHSAARGSAGGKKIRPSVRRPQEYLDPVSSFMMLRGVLRLPVEQKPEETPLHTTGNQKWSCL